MSLLASPRVLEATIQVRCSTACWDDFWMWQQAVKWLGIYRHSQRSAAGVNADGKRLLYEGNWSKGVREGTGTFYYPSGEIYSGQFATLQSEMN